MPQKTIKYTKSRSAKRDVSPKGTASILAKDAHDSIKILNQTFGLWHGRPLDPVAYQRKMRSSYTTHRRKSR